MIFSSSYVYSSIVLIVLISYRCLSEYIAQQCPDLRQFYRYRIIKLFACLLKHAN